MDPEKCPPDQGINPALLSMANLGTVFSIQPPVSSTALDQTTWDAAVPWVMGAEDRYYEDSWDIYANSGVSAIFREPNSLPPDRCDNGSETSSQNLGESTPGSSTSVPLVSHSINQSLVLFDGSFKPSQPTPITDMEQRPLDSSRMVYYTSSDTASPIVTPRSSEDENVPAVLPSQTSSRTAPSLSSSRKRRHDEMKGMTSTFPIRENLAPVSRTKKKYLPCRKEEVALVRKVGACPRCRFRKVSFQFPRPCYQCQKAAGSLTVASLICVRETLFETRFGGWDILFESFTKEFLRNEIQTYHGAERQLRLGLAYDENSPHASTLQVTVRDYSAGDTEDEVIYNVVAIDKKVFENIPSERYAIIQQSMPTVDDILKWVQMDLPIIEGDLVQRMIIGLKNFMIQYCEHRPPLPMSDLLAGSIIILKLIHCWRSNKLIVSENPQLNGLLASKVTSSQILLIVKEGIREAESVILKALEKLIYGAAGPGEKNMVPLWACLWSLILTYRDCMVVYKQYSLAERRGTRQPGCTDHEMLIDASKRMYNVLTANYSALFRVSSPLHLDWRIGTNFDLIGKDPVLKGAFYDLRNEVFRFYETDNQLFAEDSLLKSLIIDQERGLGPVNPIGLSQWQTI